jgi:hypothetical protein
MKKQNKIYVLDYGWILVGVPTEDDEWSLKDACVVRSWSNGLGIGALARTRHKDEYALDYIGDAEVQAERVIFTIPCEW